MNMRTENWNGYVIRFVEIDGEWYAILKDICSALGLRTDNVANRLDPDMLQRVSVEGISNRPATYSGNSEFHNTVKKGYEKRETTRTFSMLAINEEGIYESLYASRKLEARKFRRWSASVMRRLRKTVGLEQYEVLKMMDPEVQNQIDYILDSLYFDADRGIWMRSVTVPGGDVEQVPFESVEEVIRKGAMLK